MKNQYLCTAKINRVIQHLNLEVVRGNGYSYFLDLDSRDQVGESVMVAGLSQYSLEQWIEEATAARNSVVSVE